MLRTTHTVALWLCTVPLLLCMDIETNPGREENSNILQIKELKFAKVMHAMQAYTMNICRIIDEKWTNVDNSFCHFTAQIGELRHCIEQNKKDIEDLQQDRETIRERLDKLEQIDATEMETRRSNLKFIATREPHGGRATLAGSSKLLMF